MNGRINHSFAIAAYGDSPYLEECISSIKNQSIGSEIFISTSTPSPFLKKISKNYDVPLKINKGRKDIASDWSFAYSECRTDFLTLAHQDDIYLPQYTQNCLEMIQNTKNTLIVFTNYNELVKDRLQNNNIRLIIKKIMLSPYLFKNKIESPFWKKLPLALGSPISCPSIMYNKKLIGNFTFSEDFTINLDWEALLRLALFNGYFIYINKIMMTHRLHESAESFKGLQDNRRNAEDDAIFSKIWPLPIAKIISRIYSLSRRI